MPFLRAFLLGLPFGHFIYTLSRYLCIYEKKIQNFSLKMKFWGGGFQQPSRPEREGWQQNLT